MDANPGIADIGPRLPLNVMVTLPDIQMPADTREGVVLWD
ncbi:tail protein [Xanthomonas phage FoX2]|uniref:Tail protein n=1 Tax=Xanthomonas phage FoX2 TaxID=2723898 RepID=A0A858NQ96_9CAUD|nr:tail protein [Xanthomonas phage FoX2]QJB21846.1 tail protein [Xanthomonas phage FoX2]